MARYVEPNDEGYAHAGEELRAGRLIAFPTETVYGLGANALNAEAVLSIFTAKGRPLTDPLIVHVPSMDEALKLVDLTPDGRRLFECLGNAFWPGPLTLIARAVPQLPLTVSANTGFVGIRCPAHPIAQRLLQAAQVPVAAPSANRFGHVSPTAPHHVMDDLGHCSNLGILQNGGQACCQVGIESTVLKIVPEERKLVIFRRGGISEKALRDVLQQNHELLGGPYAIVTIQKQVHENTAEAQQAPGQLLTHYAPDVDTYLFQREAPESFDVENDHVSMAKWVVIDFNSQLLHLKDRVAAYVDLSDKGNVEEASHRIFDTLRWAENVEGVERVIVTDVANVDHEHAAALHDRMFRAASGKIRTLPLVSPS